MAQELLDRLKEILSEAIESYKAIPKLTELQEEANKAFNKQIEQLQAKKDFVRRIKVPKINLKFWEREKKGLEVPVWKYLVGAPFIYGALIPSFVFHLAIEIYHQISFRLYGIPLVNPKDYFIYDRQLFDMLNFWEKVNCKYCSYFNNLVRYSMEIGGRTERYWCPIKYYKRIENSHSQYTKFIDGNDSKKILQRREDLRDFSDLE